MWASTNSLSKQWLWDGYCGIVCKKAHVLHAD